MKQSTRSPLGMTRRRALAVLLGLVLAAAGLQAPPVPAQTARTAASDLVFVQRGTVPILLTAPHGGRKPVPGVAERKSGVVLNDAFTDEVTRQLAARLEPLLGGKPYVVLAEFHRKYIDANRPEAEAIESPAARPHYQAYHQAIRGFVDELRRKHPNGALLLDIHGQAKDADTVYRGTQNGTTVMQLLKRHGDGALIGPESLFGRLHAAGIKVFPPNTPVGNPPEERAYAGGFTVRTYGSHTTNGIDAVQLELGRNLRDAKVRRTEFVEALAQAVAGHYRTYHLPAARGVPAQTKSQ